MAISVIEMMEKRKSVRTYEPLPISEEVRNSVKAYLAEEENLRGPLGGRAHIEWVPAKGTDSGKGIKLGTYGVIQNPQAYLVGRIRNDSQGLMEFGYIFQKLILHATALGLGTCWIGGTFSRNSFAREIELAQDEIIPCITPVGYARQKQRLLDSTMRYVVKADHRKPWQELFFDAAYGTPLLPEHAGSLAAPLEMVRLGPSASNKQPWRLVISPDRRQIHFYLLPNPNYGGNKIGFEMQRIDIGIAVCNFDLACRELGIAGVWSVNNPQLGQNPQAEYIVSMKLS